MTREEILRTVADSEDKIFAAHILDLINDSERKHCIKYTSFLDLRQKKLCENIFNKAVFKDYCFYNIASDCDREIAVIGSTQFQKEKLPIKIIKVSSSQLSRLSHRDYLGTLMALGIKREAVGDIIITDESCFIAVTNEVCDFIIQNVYKIGGVGVNLEVVSLDKLPQFEKAFENKTGFASAMRIDCVASCLLETSRTKAQEAVLKGLVYIDGKETIKTDTPVKCGAVITIRKKGKFIIDEYQPTKKDRLKINYRKYI